MNAVNPLPSGERLFISGNEAVARGAWGAGCKVMAAYPGTPATEILEYASRLPEMYSEWSVNEKVSLEICIGASLAGSRALCAMKHVGLNVASDALMTQTLIGVGGGLVIAVADDVGLSSSQNEQDSRFWGRFAHVPVLEPADAQEAYDLTRFAFDLSEQFDTPVILRMTTRICHVKGVVGTSERRPLNSGVGFKKDPARLVMIPTNAKHRIPLMYQREERLQQYSEGSDLNFVKEGSDKRVGFVTSGPVFMHIQEAYPEAPILKLGMSYPVPMEKIRDFASQVDQLVVAEEVEPILEGEIKAAGIQVLGKEILPRIGELAPQVLRPAIGRLLGRSRRKRHLPQRAPLPICLKLKWPRRHLAAASSQGRPPCALPARISASITVSPRSGTRQFPAISDAIRWEPATPGMRWTPRYAWVPRWALRTAWIKGAPMSTRIRRSSR